MNIYPGIPNSKSGSEKAFFKLVEKADFSDDYLALHSVNLHSHAKKFIGEIDFVFVTPSGILSVEIKGGVLSCNDREWFTEPKTKPGQLFKLKESPFVQAKDNMFALKDEIEGKTPFKYGLNILGYGVVFPDCTFFGESQEFDSNLLFDSHFLNRDDPVSDMISRLEKYWRKKLKNPPKLFDLSEMKQLKKWLKPKFCGVRSLSASKLEIETRMNELMDFQLNFLKSAFVNSRILCEGGAGTGKTIVGIEFLRFKSEFKETKQPLFIGPSILCKKLRKIHPWLRIHESERLEELQENCCDVLVVDESQDLMNDDDFLELDKCLIGGLEDGNWLFLLDPVNQTNVCGEFRKECHEMLLSCGTRLTLGTNVRNTIEVIDATKRLLGRDIGTIGTGKGARIQWLEYPVNESPNKVVSDLIRDMSIEGINLAEIALISKNGSLGESSLSDLAKVEFSVCEIENYDPQENVIIHCNASTSKGMEFPYVIICLDDFGESPFSSNEFYIAMTRSTVRLTIVFPCDKRGLIKRTWKRV